MNPTERHARNLARLAELERESVEWFMVESVQKRNDAVLALIRGVIERHARFGIYDECGHDHVEGDGSVDCQDFRSCEHLYDLCAHCSVLDPDYPCAPDPDLETRWPCADYLAAENALGEGSGCTTPGCPGDIRYSAPGRGHAAGCTYPLRADAEEGK